LSAHRALPDEVRDALRRHIDLKNLSVLKAGDLHALPRQII
jgi:hypothetical protein